MLTNLQNDNINTRANIMCFVEVLMDVANREGQQVYLRMLQRDMIQIVSTITPDDGVSAINVPLTRKVGREYGRPPMQARFWLTLT